MEDNIDTNEGNLASDDKKAPILSKWWLIIIGFVMIYGFTFVLILTFKAYHDKPPIPQYVLDMNGDKIFVEKDIKEGQEIFLRYGLMDNGTIWGHGAYLGPDFPALYLHRLGQVTQEMVSWELFGKSWINLNKNEQYVAESQVEDILKQNRYDETTGILYFSPYEEAAFVNEIQMWREYFSSPENNGGLTANLISSDEELFKLTAYFSWAAWASVANRPGLNYSYTNNFPFDTTVGNKPSPATMLWSVVSLIFLLGGIGLILFILGKNRDWEWYGNTNEIKPYTTPGFASHSQKALVKFTAVVGVLFLAQTLVGGGVAHYRADPGSFYGIDLSGFFPSSLLRTWHLQLAIFWIATGFVAGGLYLARVLGGIEFKGQRLLTNLLFAAFALVIFGSLLFEWAGLAGWWDNATFWLGSQGWEYLELGRLWQILMIVGLLSWFIIVLRATRPGLKRPSTKRLTWMFLISAIAIPVFYLPALFYNGQTHYTIVDTWRFWIIHLWVEGFFELFATTMVALIFIELGLVSKTTGLRIIYLDTILIFMGGIIGTGHHWYFSGQSQFNMALSGCFSALEVVPLTILCMEGYSFIKTANNPLQTSSVNRYKWTLKYLMAVGFWNFLGAGVFGFIINMPIISYFEIGTYLTPNHGHAAMFGVFGMLSLALCSFIMRSVSDDRHWKSVEKFIRISFWGTNIGLAMMLLLSLLPSGLYQITDVIQNGYWHARSADFTGNTAMRILGWLRMPGDIVVIILGALPFLIAGLKTWFMPKNNN